MDSPPTATASHTTEQPLDETQRIQAKIERWETDGHPRHPIWQFFTHAQTHHDEHTSSPHLTTKVHDAMDVVCALCGAHLHAEHELKRGEDEPQQQLTLARSVLHGMWDHLAANCAACSDDVRRDMKSWQQLPKETRAERPAPVVGDETETARSPTK